MSIGLSKTMPGRNCSTPDQLAAAVGAHHVDLVPGELPEDHRVVVVLRELGLGGQRGVVRCRPGRPSGRRHRCRAPATGTHRCRAGCSGTPRRRWWWPEGVVELRVLHRREDPTAGVARRVVHRRGAVERRPPTAWSRSRSRCTAGSASSSTASRSCRPCWWRSTGRCPPARGPGSAPASPASSRRCRRSPRPSPRRSGTGCAGPSGRSPGGSCRPGPRPRGRGCRPGRCTTRRPSTLIRSTLPRRSLVLPAERWAS